MHQLFEIYAQAGVFDAEEVCILTAAFDETWQAVQDSGGLFASNGEAEATRDFIALRIIAMARFGELDCGRLRAGALLYLARNGSSAAGIGLGSPTFSLFTVADLDHKCVDKYNRLIVDISGDSTA